MEQSEQVINTNASYWPSVGIAALIFSLLTSTLQLITGYIQINSEPSGSMFSPAMFSGIAICLIGAFGGMVAVWHYAREYQVTMKLGKGALIGFLTGVVMLLIGIALNKIWLLIDPEFTQKLMDSTMANFEAMDVPENQKQQMMDGAAQQFENNQSIVTQLIWGIPMFGILNLLTGMLGVSLFAREKENT